MIFRANEATENGRRHALGRFVGRSIDMTESARSRAVLESIIDQHGPVIDAYPSWHPLVASNQERQSPVTLPGDRCGYDGLDHTVFLRNGFVTCPYRNGEAVLQSVERLNDQDVTKGLVTIEGQRIEAQLYHPSAAPILVTCKWHRRLHPDGTIPAALAVPLLLERELLAWRSAQVAETWRTMAIYILGQPCGSRSSLFVNEEAGQTLKTTWNTLIKTGMFGPVRADAW
jgi:hypothetical protein